MSLRFFPYIIAHYHLLYFPPAKMHCTVAFVSSTYRQESAKHTGLISDSQKL